MAMIKQKPEKTKLNENAFAKKPNPPIVVIRIKVVSQPKFREKYFVNNPVKVLTIAAREIIKPTSFSPNPNEMLINESSNGTLSYKPSMMI